VLIGRAKTTLWEEIFELDPKPYELELAAVDGCAAGSVFIAAAGGSRRSGIWGELLTEAAARRGCAGAVVDGAVRDVVKMRRLGFPVYALGTAVHDSRNRQRIIAVDCAVELGGVRVDPDALIIADEDGLIVVPKAVEAEAIERALKKAAAENRVRDAIRGGLSAQEAWKRYGVL
jgi:regulator of RNase E activity RraA